MGKMDAHSLHASSGPKGKRDSSRVSALKALRGHFHSNWKGVNCILPSLLDGLGEMTLQALLPDSLHGKEALRASWELIWG